jgi:hypothetical protein
MKREAGYEVNYAKVTEVAETISDKYWKNHKRKKDIKSNLFLEIGLAIEQNMESETFNPNQVIIKAVKKVMNDFDLTLVQSS